MHVRFLPGGRREADQDYLVIAMHVTARLGLPAAIELSLLDVDGFPNRVSGCDVEVVDTTIPVPWGIEASGVSISIGPSTMAREDFWGQFWGERGPDDDGRWVQPIYRAEIERLVAEVGTDFDRAALAALPLWAKEPG